ncbi:MAG: ribosomal-processing cysteine protease Prp [Treponema sp.]|nr:ribosomal-processing cysteine protease Prp [Treponema sp.]
MTCVTLVKSRTGHNLSFKAEGHAGFGIKGEDIVCSAVSTLCRTALEVLDSSSGIKLETDVSRRGFISFAAGIDKADALLVQKLTTIGEVLEKGFMMIQEQYPDNLRFELILED